METCPQCTCLLRITKSYTEVLNDDTPNMRTIVNTVQELSCTNSKHNQKHTDGNIQSKPCLLCGTVLKVIRHPVKIGGDT